MRWAIALLAMTAPVAAQEPVPAFGACRDIAIERLERELRWHVEGAFAEQVPVADLAGMAYCGEAGIFLCDQEDAADTCHEALTAQQDALRAEVLASLPAPEVVAGRRGMWSDALYPRMHALAHGHSAGPDCAGVAVGDGPRCGARAANRRLDITLRAWVLARYLGAAPDAISAGWAGPPPPTRPRARE
ncbi:hypothetical protein [Lacimonas salitolerans]|uniref:Lysozyme inhibitor LprI N-terminal domain-containing protein n=1 Tax=Lacimonas salitolerans TaxID=1323750 RepID=A0ABW4EGG0_9RHOB